MGERDEECYSSNAIGEVSYNIQRKYAVYSAYEKSNSKDKKVMLEVMQKNCDHPLLLRLKSSGKCEAEYCVSCGRTKREYVGDENVLIGFHNDDRTIDFTQNPISMSLVAEDSLVVRAVEKLAAESSADLSVSEFIKTISPELLVSPNAIKEVLKYKSKTRK